MKTSKKILSLALTLLLSLNVLAFTASAEAPLDERSMRTIQSLTGLLMTDIQALLGITAKNGSRNMTQRLRQQQQKSTMLLIH